MPVRLSDHSLKDFDLARKPAYDRRDITPGILHIGIGGFHRAHQAVYTEGVLAGGDHRWGIIGASVRSTTMPKPTHSTELSIHGLHQGRGQQ